MDKTKWLVDQFYKHITEAKKKRFAELIENRTRHVTVVLENLFQPHNASAVLRSCDCFGIQDAHIIENYNKYEVNREIDMGSSKWLNTFKYKKSAHNTLEAITHLKSKGYKIIATTPHTNDRMIDELAIDEPIALMFGTELGGLTDVALEHADAFVKLPMYGFTESYNISVCVALALYDVTERMRKDPKINWQLSDQEKNEILLAWAKNVVKHPQKVEAIYNERFEEE